MLKQKIKIRVLVITLLILIGATIGILFAPPYIANLKIRNRYGNMKSWTDYLKKEEAYFWADTYWNGELSKFRYSPRDEDVTYISNKVYKVHDGLYLVGARG